MNLSTGEVTKVIDTEFKTGHIQASRFTPGEIVFCNETGGDAHQRMWFCTADGTVFKPLYKETPLDWVTHETLQPRFCIFQYLRISAASSQTGKWYCAYQFAYG
ncbi:Uncharacterised protein [Phocaeicola vulgatus]|nr:Uncharacterised protein [Phocaeicola vulgatus]